MDRRFFLQSSLFATLAAQGLWPRHVSAANTMETGGMRLDMVSDGNLVLPFDSTLDSLPADFLAELRARYGLGSGQMTPPCNHTLLRDGPRTVLFDTGAGFDFMPSAGKLPESLDALGVAPEDITHLVITHAHPDHIWGLLDDFDEPFLPNAQIIMGRAEWDYWTDPDTVDTIGADRQAFAVGAARRLDVVADQVALIEEGAEVLPGVQAIATPGHTPGHMSYQVQLGGQGVLVTGDAIGNGHIAFERPEFPSTSDQDPQTGAMTRAALLDRITADGLLVAGFHVGDGGLGRAEKLAGGGYRFTAEM